MFKVKCIKLVEIITRSCLFNWSDNSSLQQIFHSLLTIPQNMHLLDFYRECQGAQLHQETSLVSIYVFLEILWSDLELERLQMVWLICYVNCQYD